jgi:holliday junction DNA helicase RuvA
MIGQLLGKIIVKHPPELLIDVGGVGYEVQASMNTFYKLPQVGTEITLYTHLVVREDAHILFGFYEQRERSLFRSLIKVNGVGPKMALAILSSIDPDSFVGCVANNDVASLIKMPGVGKKTAERLIIEMRDRLANWSGNAASLSSAKSDVITVNNAVHDAVSALIALGYKPADASRSVSKVAVEGLSSEELIRLALKLNNR